MTIASSILFLLALVFVPELLSSPSFADEPITVNPSITIGNSGVLSLAVNPGQFASTSQDVVVTTSNYTGYTMTIAPSSGSNTDLEHTAVSNVTIPTITPTAPATSITSSDFSNLNTAAYGLSIDDGTNYLPVVSGSTIKSTSTATDATTGSFSLTLGAKTLTDTPAGSYTKTFVLTATTNDAAYNITYDANAGNDTVTNMPSANESTISGLNVTISSKTPTRAGYTFSHWNTADDNTGTSYSVSDTIELDATTANPISLYAIWEEISFRIIYDGNDASAGSMSAQIHNGLQAGVSLQLRAPDYSKTDYGFVGWSPVQVDPDANNASATINNLFSQGLIYGPNETIIVPSYIDYGQTIDGQSTIVLYAVWASSAGSLQSYSCALSEGEVSALTDDRDGETYAIARLADGNCWIIENLRLGSNVSTADMTSGSDGKGGKFTKLPTSVITDWGSNTENDTYGPNADGNTYNRIILPQLNDNNTNRNLGASPVSNNNNSSWWSYGNYYSWAAARANTSTMNSAAQSAAEVTSICPSGWHLPSGGSTGEYATLLTSFDEEVDSTDSTRATNSAVARHYPNNFTLGGSWSGTAATAKNSNGIYWASTAADTNNAYRFVVGTTNVAGVSNNRKWNGYSVRCVADDGYRIIYNANNGATTGNTKNINYPLTNSPIILSSGSLFEKQFYHFVEWNTAPDGSGTSYSGGGDYALPANAQAGDSINLYAIWGINPYSLRYQTNGGSGSMAQIGHIGVYEGDLITLTAPALTRTGYAFVGWSLDPDADPNDSNDIIHGPNETITAPNYETYGVGSNVYEYAIWKQSEGSMQNFSCTDLELNEVTALTDSRDGETYMVVRQSDGKCWMGDNLRLDPSTANINSSNTNSPTNGFLTEIANSSSTAVLPCMVHDDQTCMETVVFNTENLTDGLGNLTFLRHEYGVYYNWYTATAGNGLGVSTGQANGDICPQGWHLPTANEYNFLVASTGVSSNVASPTLRHYPYNFINSGRLTDQGLVNIATLGINWASNDYNFENAYRFVLGASDITTNWEYKVQGYTVRCVVTSPSYTFTISAGTGVDSVEIDGVSYEDGDTVSLEEGTVHSINVTFDSGYEFDSWSVSGTGTSVASTSTQSTTLTMGTANSTLTANGKVAKQYLQDWNGCGSMSVGKANAITLYDKRDEQAYTVTKYNMGSGTAKCWMSNLNLGDTDNYPLVVSQLDSTNSDMATASAIPAATFNSWKNNSVNDYYTNAVYVPITTSNSQNGLTEDSYGNKYGTLYNYAAASANTINAAREANNDNASNSLCPKGWRLPTGGDSSGEFQNLYDANSITSSTAGSTKLQQDFDFALAGSSHYGTPYNQGSNGFYWSSTRHNGSAMYHLHFNSSNVDTPAYTSRDIGYSVRCIKE